MKFVLTLITILLNIAGAYSQDIMSYVENGKPYINYTVIKSEGINFIASKLAITPAELMAANGLQLNSVLNEGQQLKIPLEHILKTSCDGNNCLKLFYDVQQHEGLYRIGKNFGDIKVSQLKQLNKLSSDALAPGQRLLVGYLQANTTDGKQLSESSNSKKPLDSVAPAIRSGSASATRIENDSNEKKIDTPVVKTPVVIVNQPKPINPKKGTPDTTTLNYGGNGFFEGQYKSGTTEAIMNAATFKSESGWNDGKFYVLMDSIPNGTILKITNPVSAAIIYAKVLGPLPALKDNNAIKMRINSAGAALLGLRNEEHFELLINY